MPDCPPAPSARRAHLACIARLVSVITLALFAVLPAEDVRAQAAQSVLAQYIGDVAAGDLVEGADAFGPIRDDMPVAPVLRDGERIGWAFIASDYVGTTGYSGKPIHTMVAVDDDAVVLGVELVKHSEPIVLIGIPESKIAALPRTYAGLDLVAEAESGGTAHDLDIIAGATVTIMVIDDSIVRAGLKVARDLGLGGLTPPQAPTGPRFEIAPDATAAEDWETLAGDGTLRRLSLDVGEVNAAFETVDDPRAAERPITEPPETTFIDMYMGLVSVPAVGEAENANLQAWLEEGEHAIMVAGDGLYPFKGSGYVRGGIFDRIVLIQGDSSVRFRDKMHRRLGRVAAPGAPGFRETDLFKIPADVGFDPTEPFRLQLLVQRDVAAIERVFTTFEMSYELPAQYIREIPGSAPPPARARPWPTGTSWPRNRRCGNASGGTRRRRSWCWA